MTHLFASLASLSDANAIASCRVEVRPYDEGMTTTWRTQQRLPKPPFSQPQ